MFCNLSDRNCMPRSCENCPGIHELKKYLKYSFFEFYLNECGNVYSKQWVQTENGVTISEMTHSVNEFIGKSCSMFDSLIWHHFIDKVQSQFPTEAKENLQQNHCIVLFDFADNYSYSLKNGTFRVF